MRVSYGIGINTRDWDDSAPDRDYCRALVNAVLNLRGFLNNGVTHLAKCRFSLTYLKVCSWINYIKS